MVGAGERVLTQTMRQSYPDIDLWMIVTLYYMTRNVAERISLDDLARCSGISKFNLCREFRNQILIPPLQWLWRFRVILAAELLRMPIHWDVQEIAFQCGFNSSTHFSRLFKQTYGVSPGAYRKKIARISSNGSFANPPSLAGFDCEVLRSAFEKAIAKPTS